MSGEAPAHPEILIVYYSRSGATRTIATRLAELLGCETEELIDTKDRAGLRGWFASLFDAVLSRKTTLAPCKHDPGDYDLVVIGTPIWAFNMSAPVRTYLEMQHARLRDVAFFVTHNGIARARVFARMARLAGRIPRGELGITARELDRGEHFGQVRDFASGLAGLLQADETGTDPSTETLAELADCG